MCIDIGLNKLVFAENMPEHRSNVDFVFRFLRADMMELIKLVLSNKEQMLKWLDLRIRPHNLINAHRHWTDHDHSHSVHHRRGQRAIIETRTRYLPLTKRALCQVSFHGIL